MKTVATLLLAPVLCVWGYVPNPIDATPFHRVDYLGVQFLINQNIAAGILNAAGNVWITADSSPITAINNAMAAWNAVSTTAARFQPPQTTNLSYSTQNPDGDNVIVFVDDPFTETFTNGVVAITGIAYYSTDQIYDTDIFFSPSVEFSTTGAAGTFDLQSAVTHELGHALGANHTNILSATMYAFTTQQDMHEQTLTADDVAFVSTLYPAVSGNGYGTVSGTATVSGSPLQGGMITAVDIFTGTTIGGISSVVDGSFSIEVPPGNYYVYVEPSVNLSLYEQNSQTTEVFTAFQPGFAGGNSQPSIVTVQAGQNVGVALSGIPGVTPLRTPLMAIGAAGETGDYNGEFVSGSLTVSSGQSVDLLFSNPLPGTPTESNIEVIGAASMVAGTLRKDTITVSGGTPVYRVTLTIPPLTANSSATVVFTDGSNWITRSGVLNLTRPQSVNAASFVGGPVAPGEILSFFGSQLGPAGPSSNGGFGAGGTLPVSLGGITVAFDNIAAPLFYVSDSQINLQVPYEVAGRASTHMVVNYNGLQAASNTLSVAKSAPGIFVVTNADGSVNGANSPSPAGAVLVIYGTGSGTTAGFPETGAPAPANSTVAAAVTIGGAPVTPIFAGLTAGSVGLMQINVAIPPGTPSGSAIPLQVTIAGNPSQTVNIAVQ
jgi:uncharacterized protein (TIGR03437 family)